jgi:hypothetical protein
MHELDLKEKPPCPPLVAAQHAHVFGTKGDTPTRSRKPTPNLCPPNGVRQVGPILGGHSGKVLTHSEQDGLGNGTYFRSIF